MQRAIFWNEAILTIIIIIIIYNLIKHLILYLI